MNRTNKKIVAGTMAGCCVLSSQTLVQYGLLVGNGGIENKNSPNFQALGASFGASEENKNVFIYGNFKYKLDDEKKEATLAECIDKNITEVTIPEYVQQGDTNYAVTSLGIGAFYGCEKLKNVVLNDSLKIISDQAFWKCINLETINILEGVTFIHSLAFGWCNMLKSINVDEDNQNYKSVDGILFTKDGKRLVKCPVAKKVDTYAIPEGVESILYSAFAGCSSLKVIKIPKTVKTIGGRAFSYCQNLETIIFKEGSSLGTIYDNAFNNCNSLKSIYIPTGAQFEVGLILMGLDDKIKYLGNAEGNTSEASDFVQVNDQGSNSQGSNSQGSTNNRENMGNQNTIAGQDSVSSGSELVLGKEGSSKSLAANLYDKITASSVDNSKISDSFKTSIKKVINKVEDILKVKDNTSNSLVVDVSSVNEDINKNEITLNLDKSYIDKEVYITCIYDENNIFYLTGDGKWEKLTEETKEIKGVKISTSRSIKFQGMMKQCVFIVTRKD